RIKCESYLYSLFWLAISDDLSSKEISITTISMLKLSFPIGLKHNFEYQNSPPEKVPAASSSANIITPPLSSPYTKKEDIEIFGLIAVLLNLPVGRQASLSVTRLYLLNSVGTTSALR